MCFVALAKHMHTNRCMDANDTIYTFFFVLIYISTHKVVQTWLINIQNIGWNMGTFMYWSSLTFLHVLHTSSQHISTWEVPFYTKSIPRPCYRVILLTHIHYNMYFNIKHPYYHLWTDILHIDKFVYVLLSKSYMWA